MTGMRWVALIGATVLLGGCVAPSSITGSGRLVTREFELSGFSKVAASSAFQVEIVQSESYSVVVTVDDNLEQYLEVSKSGDTLRLGMKPRLTIGFRSMTLKARVTLPELTGVNLSGATRGTVAGFSSERGLDAEVSGASRLSGDIRCGNARLEVSGASTVELEGAGSDLNLAVSGASTVSLQDFAARNARVNVSGASRATVNVSGRLEGEASGASSVRYSGNPEQVRVNTSGASSVQQR